ncbi:hypothetical protein PIB30_045973 [Stylosanthes scabra]|uniref:TRAM domain-containing protein n=1 Tax=Stylosanthes scabra TaxID=79078 RepID=A0ABU6SGD0_9FABA|nr:hypothetical protein [Stylosanthes scabra]
MATVSSHCFFRHLTATLVPPRIPKFRASTSLSFSTVSCSLAQEEDLERVHPNGNDNTSSITTNNGKSSSYFPKRGQTLELVCESLAFKGKGLCKVTDTGFVVMCDRALPGERFIGRVTRKKGNYAEVTKVKTISPPRDIVDAPCEYASHCGGCKTQNLSYEAQLGAKEDQVHELVVHVGRFSSKELESEGVMKPIVPCDIQFHYRNKMEFSFGPYKWLPKESLHEREAGRDNYALGLHVPGFFDKIMNVDKCLLQSDPANKVLAAIQDCWRDPQFDFSPYDVHSHKGFLKHLMLRTGRDVVTGHPEVMVNFVTSSYKPELLKFLVDKVSAFPEVVSIMNNVNSSVGNTSVGEEEYTLYGKSFITETLRGLTFQISANSFFQTNTRQAEVLYELIEKYAGISGDGSEVVLDLFCGTGTIGLTLARSVKHVYGYEVVPQAIADAHPNRPGMHMKLIKFLLKLRVPRIVYVSCNPATCARDLDYLCHGVAEQNIEGCYKLSFVDLQSPFHVKRA